MLSICWSVCLSLYFSLCLSVCQSVRQGALTDHILDIVKRGSQSIIGFLMAIDDCLTKFKMIVSALFVDSTSLMRRRETNSVQNVIRSSLMHFKSCLDELYIMIGAD